MKCVNHMQVSDWFEQVGDVYLNKKDLGSSLAMANALRDEQVHFERQARVCSGLRTSHVSNTFTALQSIIYIFIHLTGSIK